MENKIVMWKAMQDAIAAIAAQLSPAVLEKLESSSIAGQNLYPLGVAYYAHPEPINIKHLVDRNPYSRQEKLAEAIQLLRDAGHLDENDVITDEAYNEYQSLIDAQDAQARSLNLMDEAELVALVNLLEKAHDAALKLDEPCFQHVTRKPLAENTLHRIYYFIYRFSALRDGVHAQAWQHLNIDGHKHEAGSLVWNGTANTVEKILELRPNRGYDAKDWQETLDGLVSSGWLVKNGEEYAVSEEYERIREDVEAKTEELFHQIFIAFSQDEIENLITLLRGVQDKFTPEPEAT